MSESTEGGCQCGYVRYRLDLPGPVDRGTGTVDNLAVCHCKACQRQSGSAFGMSLGVPADAFVLVAGKLKTFEVTCDSGRIKRCAFCPECGTRIYHRTVNGMSIKAGTLDDTSWLEPAAHYWTMKKQAWVVVPDGVARFVDDD